MTLAIETSDLQYATGRGGNAFTVSGLNMHVPRGTVYGFLGPNGSGKTTTIRLLLGLLRPDSGQITVLGESMPAHYPSVLARTGYVLKRLRLTSAPADWENPPFAVLSRTRTSAIVEDMLVSGWRPDMQEYLTGAGATVREVVDLDLEEGFVEMLRAARTSR